MRSTGRKFSSIFVALTLAGAAAIGTASPAAATPTTVFVNNLQPSFAAAGGGGVYSAYYGPVLGYAPDSPGSTAVYDGREAGIIKAGVEAYAPLSYDDEGLFAFKPYVTTGTFAAGPLTYDVANASGANPVWITIEIDTGPLYDPASGWRDDNIVYQYVPPTNPAGWHTVNAGSASTWQAWTTPGSGIPTGPLVTLAGIAGGYPGKMVVRTYLRLGMGDSYGVPDPTIGWVDKITIADVTYDFRTLCTTTCYVNDATGDDTASGHADDPVKTIQQGIDLVSSGGTVNVAAGTYTENVMIDKPVTLTGAGAGTTTVRPAVSIPNPCAGSSLCGSATAASNVMLVQADDVTISGFTIDGDNTLLTSGIVVGGADIDARNGIVTDYYLGTWLNLEVHDVTVQNIYLRGIYSSQKSGELFGGTFNFHDNTVTNVQADPSSIALFNFGGGGAFTDNTVSGANDGIASNHSTGTTVTGNTVTGSSSGIHTDNAGDAGGTPDLIQGNTVSSCTTDGYGIWVFVPYVAPTVTENSVTGCTVGMGAFGGAFSPDPTVTTSFTKNTVDGTGATGSSSLGFYIDTTTFYWGETSVAVSASNNFIQDFDTGLAVIENGGFAATADLNNNSITGNAIGIDDTSTVTDPDLTSNWWGSATGPTNATLNALGTGDTVGTGVDFRPWLCSGTDTAPATPGFQPSAALCPTVAVGADQSAAEGNSGTSTLSLPVNLVGAESPPGGMTVTWSTANGTATTVDSDYVGVVSGSAVIPAGNTAGTLDVTVNGDTTLEANQNLTATITAASDGFQLGGDLAATATILNDDAPVAGFNAASAVTRREYNSGTTSVNFAVNLSHPNTNTVTVPWNTVDGSAHAAGNDFVAASGTLTFTPGDTSETLSVSIKGDTTLEDYEAFSVQLGTPTNASLGTSSRQIVISNDEKPTIVLNNCVGVIEGNKCTFAPHLSHKYYQNIPAKAYTSNNTATAPTDFTALVNHQFTFAAGTYGTTNIQVQTKLDSQTEPSQSFYFTVSTFGFKPLVTRFGSIKANAT